MPFNPQLRRRTQGLKTPEKFNPVTPTGISTEYTTGERWFVYRDAVRIGVIHETFDGRYQVGEAGAIYPDFPACRDAIAAATRG